MHTFDISLESLTKVEGSAALDVHVENGKVTDVRFQITEYKRFFTEAMKGKPLGAIPQHLARICGTCSNAHLMCSIEAGEDALGITPSEQTRVLRALTMHGLIIRDHALHLYLFVLPDMYNKDSFLDFDENNEEEHQHLHDCIINNKQPMPSAEQGLAVQAVLDAIRESSRRGEGVAVKL